MSIEARTHCIESHFDETAKLQEDTLLGFSLPTKELASYYCFDAKGTELFHQLRVSAPDASTLCEAGILEANRNALSLHIGDKPFRLTELGLGSGGINSRILLEHFLQDSPSFTYHLIDLSKNYLEKMSKELQVAFPSLACKALHADYLSDLKVIKPATHKKNIVLLLGPTIGKIPSFYLPSFLKQLRRLLNAGDCVLIGFDLRKNIERLLTDYNQPDGLYKKLHLNLLERLNRELGGNFNIAKFECLASYNKEMESVNTLLISKENHTVAIDSLKKSFSFRANEPIYLSIDAKYREQQIISLAEENGFEVTQLFTDEGKNFINCLWEINK